MSLFASIPLVGRLVGAAPAVPAVRIEPVPVHAVETSPEKRPRTLKHLLRANHVNHALFHGPNSRRHNHMAHALCSAYLLGATPEQLNHIYDAIAPRLAAWQSSPAEIADADWRDFLGDPAYQRAYVDFFEDVLAEHSVAYNWKRVVEMYLLGWGREESGGGGDAQAAGLLQGPAGPLVNGLISGLGHPLIHLAYAYEMDSRVLAMEALGMTAVAHNPDLQRLVDDRAYRARPVVPGDLKGAPLAELLDRLARDARFDDVPSGGSVEAVLLESPPATEAALLAYWNAWDLDPAGGPLDDRLRDVQEAAVSLLVATVAPGTHSYNFFVCHVLTTSHAVRVLLPNIPAKFHVDVLRQWWLLTLGVYVAVGRPAVDPDYVPTDRKGKGWTYVEEQALASRWSTDAHYVKAIRAIKEAARTWGDVHDRYLNAAVRFVDDFEGWIR